VRKGREEFEQDALLQAATIRFLEVIGEAAEGISPAFRDIHHDVPWRGLARLRDRLVHGYFDIDVAVVWQTVEHDLPAVAGKIRSLLAESQGL